MDVRHQVRRRLPLALENRDAMLVAVTPGRVVAHPAVGVHHAARFHGVLNELQQARPRGIGNPAHADSTEPPSFELRRNGHQRFGFRLPSTPTGMHATHVGFVHLDVAGQSIAARDSCASR